MTDDFGATDNATLAERVASIAAWVGDLDARVGATEVATGDEKTAKELRKALEALTKHDPKLERRLTDRVDVLADRLATLASTVNNTASALAGKEGEIAGLRRELDKGGEQIASLMKELRGRADAAEVAKLQRAVASATPERATRGDDRRVDDLGTKVANLAQRLDTLAKTVATTAAGLVGREGEVAHLRQRLEEGSRRVEFAVAELALKQESNDLVARVESLASAVAATASGLTDRESEIAAVRTRLDEAYARVGTVVTEIRDSVGALAAQVAALEKLPGAAEQALESRAAELDGRVEALGERLESLATSVASAMTGLSEREQDLAVVDQKVDDARSRVDAVAEELRQALADLPAPGVVDPEVEARLEAVAGSVAEVTSQLEQLESAGAGRAQAAAARAAELERVLADVAERLDAVERERDAAATELARAARAWAEDREWVRQRLEELTAAHADTSQAQEGLGPQLEGLTVRLASMEEEREALTTEIARVSAVLDAERASLHAQLEELGTSLASTAAPVESDGSEQLLAELADRLDGVERDGAAVTSEIARAAAVWASERESIEARLALVASAQATAAANEATAAVDEATEQLLAKLSGRIEAMERDREALNAEMTRVSQAWASDRSMLEGRLDEVATHLVHVEAHAAGQPAPSSSGDEVAQLRVQVDGLRMRLAASEQELTALATSREVAGRLDELSRRVDGVERIAPSIVVSASGTPIPGDGRFRLELRALELRMEHAEAAAREHREAVLVQLERLASRIEWRLQRLEAEHDTDLPEAVGGGQVVPIRGRTDV